MGPLFQVRTRLLHKQRRMRIPARLDVAVLTGIMQRALGKHELLEACPGLRLCLHSAVCQCTALAPSCPGLCHAARTAIRTDTDAGTLLSCTHQLLELLADHRIVARAARLAGTEGGETAGQEAGRTAWRHGQCA